MTREGVQCLCDQIKHRGSATQPFGAQQPGAERPRVGCGAFEFAESEYRQAWTEWA